MTKSEHICRDRPGYRKGATPWRNGKVDDCPYHGRRKPTLQPRVVPNHDGNTKENK